MKWDRKKKKYVRINNNTEITPSGKIKIRNESGKNIKLQERGKLYQDWKKKNHLEIPQIGETEDQKIASKVDSHGFRKYRHNKGSKPEIEESNKKVKSELKTPEQILKDRKIKEKTKILQRSKKDPKKKELLKKFREKWKGKKNQKILKKNKK